MWILNGSGQTEFLLRSFFKANLVFLELQYGFWLGKLRALIYSRKFRLARIAKVKIVLISMILLEVLIDNWLISSRLRVFRCA